MTLMTGTRPLLAGCAGAMLAAVLATSALAEEKVMPHGNPGTEKSRFIDTHVHFFSVQNGYPGSNPSPGSSNPLDKVAEWMKTNHVRRCINLPLAQSRPRNDEDRRRMLENYAKYKGLIDRFCVIFPEEVRSVEEAVKILTREKQDGAIGFGEHYGRGLKFDDPNNMRLYAACAKVGLPVLFHMDQGKLAFEQSLVAADGRWTFEVKPKDAKSFGPIDTNGSQRQPRPFVAFFDRRLKDVEVVEGAELKPVITDDFILVERPATCDPSKTYRLVFRARPII